eukprot:1149636-Pelagomonas_calceolata.AAC.1
MDGGAGSGGCERGTGGGNAEQKRGAGGKGKAAGAVVHDAGTELAGMAACTGLEPACGSCRSTPAAGAADGAKSGGGWVAMPTGRGVGGWVAGMGG